MYTLLNILAKKILPIWIYDYLIGRWGVYGLKRYLKNAGWALFSRVFTMIIGFVATIFVVRYLGPENYGHLSYAISLVALFGIISSLGTPYIFSRELLLHPEKRNQLMGSAVALHLIGGTLSAFACALFAYFYLEDDVSRLAVLILSSTLIFSTYSPIVVEFTAKVEQKYISYVTMTVVLLLNFLKFLVIYSDQGVLWFVTILLVEPIIYALAYLYFSHSRHGSIFNWTYELSGVKNLFLASWPFIFLIGFTTIYTRIDQVMLKHFISATEVGIYDAAVRLSELWLFIPVTIAVSLYPAIVNARKTNTLEYHKRLWILLLLVIFLSLIIIIPLIIIARPLILFLYGPAFISSLPVFYIYIWSGIFVAIGTVTHHFLITENKRRVIIYTSCASAAANILLNYLLIPTYGGAGAAYATLISYGFLMIPVIMLLRSRQ